MYRKIIPANTDVFAEGEPGNTAYIIEDGLVEIFTEQDGKRLALAELGDGEIVGEMALIEDDPRPYSAVALVDTRVTVVDRDQIVNRLQATEPAIVMLIKILLSRLRNSQRELVHHGVKVQAEGPFGRTDRADLEQYKQAFEGLRREHDLRRAIEDNQIHPHFMPIYQVRGPRRLAGFEALVRWAHPQRGFVKPIEFVKFAETYGLIRRIDMTILSSAWQALSDAQKTVLGYGGVPETRVFLSVNLSAQHFADGNILNVVGEFLETSGCPAHSLDLELTESVLINDPDSAQKIINKLKSWGIRIALDDFGTGYSSLSYLHKFPIDIVKVDQCFVRGIEESDNGVQIVRTISTLAESLGMDIIAEGIETEAAERIVVDLGCRYAQGYYYSEPVPAAELPVLLDTQLGRPQASGTFGS